MSDLYNETLYIMKKNNIKANKGLGQNFLIDEEVINGIIEKSNICNNDVVIEIGPGLGALTKPLLENAGKVICIELDDRMVKIISDRFRFYNNIEIINGDILKVDLKSIINKELKIYKKVKVVANLPYYITTPIIMKLLEDRLNIDSITVMVQKEVAERLASNTGENTAGAITHAIHYYTLPKIIIDVPKTSFIPAPEVDSSVISFKVLDKPSMQVTNEAFLFKIIKLAYMQRRKTLANALSNISSKDNTEQILNELGLDTKIRGEKLTLEQFTQISELLNKQNEF